MGRRLRRCIWLPLYASALMSFEERWARARVFRELSGFGLTVVSDPVSSSFLALARWLAILLHCWGNCINRFDSMLGQGSFCFVFLVAFLASIWLRGVCC